MVDKGISFQTMHNTT